MKERKKPRRFVKVCFFILVVAFLTVPQCVFAAEKTDNSDAELVLQEQEAAEDEAAAYAADDNQEDFQGTDMELYLIMEERIKKAMLDNPEKDTIIVPLGDLKAKRKEEEGQDGNRINNLYSYSPYFPDILMVGLELYSDPFSRYYTYAEVSHTKGKKTKEIFEKIDRKLEYIYSLVDDTMSDEEKALVIHDYLVSHVHFDGSQKHWTSYGAIMLGYATAQGYNSAYQYLMNHLGMDACFVSSRLSDPQSHAWNMIQIDGKYYNVDTVCDESESARVSHKHFLLSTDDLAAIKPDSNPTKHKLEDKVHACTSTKYRNAYWREIDSPIYVQDGIHYYIKNSALCTYDPATGKETVVWGGKGSGVTTLLVKTRDALYCTDYTTVWRYSLKTGRKTVVYELPDDQKSFWDINDLRWEDGQLEITKYHASTMEYATIQQSFEEETPVADGWFEDLDGRKYFKNQKALTGWQSLDGNFYFFNETGVMQTGWVEDNGRKYYLNQDGIWKKNCWIEDGEGRHYLDGKGQKMTGWLTIGENTYYLGEDGVMQTGWVTIDGKEYYFNYEGEMLKGLQEIQMKTYLFDNNGVKLTGWQQWEGQKYYLGTDGVMYMEQWVDGTYYMRYDGTMATDWEWTGEKMEYFDENGRYVPERPWEGWSVVGGETYYYQYGDYVTGWQKIEKQQYYFASDGHMVKERWVLLEEKWYYFGNNGVMTKKQWKQIAGKWYYFEDNGVMVKNQWKQIGKTWYSFNKGGQMRASCWVGDYYVKADGAMATNQMVGTYYVGNDGKWVKNRWVLLEKKWYYFGNNGVMVKNQWKQIGKTWYSFNKDGQMRAGCWVGDYYVKEDGAMATNQWIGKYYVGNDGKWVKGKTKTA